MLLVSPIQPCSQGLSSLPLSSLKKKKRREARRETLRTRSSPISALVLNPLTLKGGSKGFQHLEDTLFRSSDAMKLYHVTGMLRNHMKH